MKNNPFISKKIWISKFKICTLYLGLFLTMIPFSGSEAQKLPPLLELIRADDLYGDKIGDVETTKIVGNVFFRKGKKELRCDYVIFYHKTELTIFKGNVQFQDSSRYLRADMVEYYAKPEKEIAKGNVFLIVDQKEIKADELTYFVDDELVIAEKNVDFRDLENNIRLFGGKITYDRQAESGEAEIKPELVQTDSLGNIEITIIAEKINYDGKNKQAAARDSVVITQKKTIAYAQSAFFFEDEAKIEMSGKPIVYQDARQLSADKIELFFEDNKLRKVHLVDKGEMLSHFLVEGEPAIDKISGVEIWVDINDDSLRKIEVFEQAMSIYHVIEDDKVQGINQVMGDEITIIFEDGKPRFVNVRSKPGFSRGQFSPPGKKPGDLKWIQ